MATMASGRRGVGDTDPIFRVDLRNMDIDASSKGAGVGANLNSSRNRKRVDEGVSDNNNNDQNILQAQYEVRFGPAEKKKITAM